MFEKLKEYNYLFDKSERKLLTAEAIKAFRLESGLQQKEVAELLKINTQTYQSYENGRCEPPLEILVRLSFLYDVSIDTLLQKSKDKKNNNDATIQFVSLLAKNKNFTEIKEMLTKIDPLTRAKISPKIKALEEATTIIWDEFLKNNNADNE